MFCCIQDLCAREADPIYVETAVELLCSNDLARSPEGVAIWLTVKDLFPAAKLPSGVWQYDDPLHVKEKRTLSKVMKEAWVSDPSVEGLGNTRVPGVWNSKLHFAWDAILVRLYSQGDNKAGKSAKPESTRASFIDFWTEVVDGRPTILRVLYLSGETNFGQMGFSRLHHPKNGNTRDFYFS